MAEVSTNLQSHENAFVKFTKRYETLNNTDRVLLEIYHSHLIMWRHIFSTSTPHVSQSWFPWQTGGRRDLRQHSRRRHGGDRKCPTTEGTFTGTYSVQRMYQIECYPRRQYLVSTFQ